MNLMAFFLLPLAGCTVFAGQVSAQQSVANQGSRADVLNRRTGKDWRFAWHNDRWWYWTADQRWVYFDGERWAKYDPQLPPSGALAAGYRKAPAFEKPPATAPRPPHSWPTARAENEAELPYSPYLEGRLNPADGLLPGVDRPRVLGGLESTATGGTGAGQLYSGANRPPAPKAKAGTGGGGFGGPQGSSLGAGSAAGGASTPR